LLEKQRLKLNKPYQASKIQKWWRVNFILWRRLKKLSQVRAKLLAVYKGWRLRKKVMKRSKVVAVVKELKAQLKKEKKCD